MSPRTGLAAVAALCPLWAVPALAASAQAPPSSAPSADERMDQFERRLNEIEQRHREELKARDEEIARLKAQVGRQPATSQPATAQSATTQTDEIEQTRQDILRDLEGRAGPVAPAPSATTPPGRAPVSFLPDLAVVADFVGSYSPTGTTTPTTAWTCASWSWTCAPPSTRAPTRWR